GWSVVSSPTSPGTTDQGFQGVSCASPKFCMAVGHYNDDHYVRHAQLMGWDGANWTILPSPATDNGSYLNGVSCSSESFCVAVGNTYGYSLIMSWDGSTWSVQNSLDTMEGSLRSVSCTSPTACTAVGVSTSNGAYIRQWDGQYWSVRYSPMNGAESELDGVSCPSATSCTAVGSSSDGTTKHPLIGSWDGLHWTVAPTVDPSAAGSGLRSVSCVSTRSCMAVGDKVPVATPVNDGTPAALVMQWNGTAWIPQATPPTDGNGEILTSVSCTSPGSCTAVGHGNTTGTLVEKWNGVAWLIDPSPNPSPVVGGTDMNHLWGVSCAKRCTAVGDYFNGSNAYLGFVMAETKS